MSVTIWIAIGVIIAIVWGLIIWEAWTAPVMPDDYGMSDEEKKIWKELNGSNNEKQYKKGFYNGEEDKWYPDNKI